MLWMLMFIFSSQYHLPQRLVNNTSNVCQKFSSETGSFDTIFFEATLKIRPTPTLQQPLNLLKDNIRAVKCNRSYAKTTFHQRITVLNNWDKYLADAVGLLLTSKCLLGIRRKIIPHFTTILVNNEANFYVYILYY